MAGQRKCRRTSRILRTLLLAVLAGAAVGVPAAQAAISVGNVSVRETNDDGVVATFRVTRIAPLLAGNTTVGFSTVDGTAHAPADYTAASGLLFFGSSLLGGEQVRFVTVAIRTDALDEPAETFRILLSGSAEIVDGEGVATIEDDDEPPPPPASPPPPPPDASPPPASAPMGEPPPPAAGDVGAAPPASAPASSDAATAPARLGLSSPRLRRPSIMLVTVSCPRSTSRCSGRVTIFSRPNPRSRIKALRRERRLGQRNFTLLSGKTRTLTIALSKSDRVRLLRAGRLLVRAYAVTRDRNGRSSVRRSSGTLIARTSHS